MSDDIRHASELLRGASRVVILGASGAGKSTFARALGNVLALPVLHLDQHYHGPNWQEPPKEVWDARLAELVARERWVIDGNYSRTLEVRLARADAAIWLDYPKHIYLVRALRRIIANHGRVRPDAAPGCPERFNLEFLKFIWCWQRDSRPSVEKALAASTTPLVRLVSPSEARKLVAALEHRESAP